MSESLSLWGESVTIPPKKKSTIPAIGHVADMIPNDCHYYGHAFEPFGLVEKRCSVCGQRAYCPGCTPIKPSPQAEPFFCTKHTLSPKERQA